MSRVKTGSPQRGAHQGSLPADVLMELVLELNEGVVARAVEGDAAQHTPDNKRPERERGVRSQYRTSDVERGGQQRPDFLGVWSNSHLVAAESLSVLDMKRTMRGSYLLRGRSLDAAELRHVHLLPEHVQGKRHALQTEKIIAVRADVDLIHNLLLL